MKKLKQVAAIGFVALMLCTPMVALAVRVPTPTAGPELGDPVTKSDIQNIITDIITFLVTFGIVIAVGFIIWGGITWMAAGGDEGKADAAKTRIWNGIKGAAIILGVGVILRTIASLINQDFFFR